MIRPLGPNDVHQFIQIRRDSFRYAPLSFQQEPDVEIDIEKTRQDLAEKNEENFVLGYFIDEELVGIWGFYRYQPKKRRHRGYIWGVYVNKDHQGKGIGKALIDECIARARTLPGLERIILTVSHQAPGALRLYKSAGFVEFGREPEAARTGDVPMDEIYLMLDL
ncbi:MAG: GNAT family N-acetyltransferase [Bacteroidota bacterium]